MEVLEGTLKGLSLLAAGDGAFIFRNPCCPLLIALLFIWSGTNLAEVVGRIFLSI